MNAYCKGSLDFAILVLSFIYPPLKSHRKALSICEVHLTCSVPLDFPIQQWLEQLWNFFSLVSHKVSQEKEVANARYNRLACFMEMKIWSLPSV